MISRINDIRKQEFRKLCCDNTSAIRARKINHVPEYSPKEAVLVEFRIFPHVEFLLRNSIYQLGESWAHTIVCGQLNGVFMTRLAQSISPNIRVIVLPHKRVSVDEYTSMMMLPRFWKLFNGEKLLIYQEDSCIFKPCPDSFLAQTDYLGAPWNKSDHITEASVGNGGFSVRTKKTMIRVLELGCEPPAPSSSVRDNMSSRGLRKIPEDVAITTLMAAHNVGRIGPFDMARAFSSESIWNSDSVGGHQFWLGTSDAVWKKRLSDDIFDRLPACSGIPSPT